MKKDIEKLLNNRTDLSPYFVHFTRGEDESAARNSLVNILDDQTLEARNAFGMAREIFSKHTTKLEEAELTQKVCCFTETPLEHWSMMAEEIAGRSRSFKPFGIVFSKDFGMKRGLNPVWYLNTTPATDHLTVPINNMVMSCMRYLDAGKDIMRQRVDGREVPVNPRFEVLRITPFMEQVGYTQFTRKDFSWEREWRKVGDLYFSPRDVAAVLAPEEEHESLQDEIGELANWKNRKFSIVDPDWDLARMMSALSTGDA